jgi:hypothetical protein
LADGAWVFFFQNSGGWLKSTRPGCGQGEAIMGDKGKKDKGKREDQKKAVLSPKEKRKAKIEKNSAK